MRSFRKLLLVVSFIIAVLVMTNGLTYAEELPTIQIPLQMNSGRLHDADLSSPEIGLTKAPSILTEPEYVDEHTAAEQVSAYMRARFGEFTVYVKTPYDPEANFNTLVTDLFDRLLDSAMDHTGDPMGGDYLKWHYGGGAGNVSGTCDYKDYYLNLTFVLGYYTTAEQEAEVDAAVQNLLDTLDLYDFNDYEKVKGIYDYITHNITYDSAGLKDDTDLLEHTAYDAIINKSAVCQGYASLLYRLSLELGVDARFISGDAGGGHGWNIVKLGRKYYYLDSTWDASRAQNGRPYDYFLLGSETFTADHTPDAEYTTEAFRAAYPVSQIDYDHAVELISENTSSGVFSSVAEAQGSMAANDVIRLLRDVEEDSTIEGNLWIDLNGYDLSGITVNGTVYGMDSATDGYTSAKAGKLTLAGGTVATDVKTTAGQVGAVKRYLAVPGADGSCSFHRFYFGITHISLRPASGGFGYKAVFAGDEAVRNFLDPDDGFGLILSVASAPESLEDGVSRGFAASAFPEECRAVSKSLLLQNILVPSLPAEDLTARAGTVIYARTFLKTKTGDVILSATQENTLRSMVEAIDTVYPSFGVYQKTLLRSFYQTYKTVFSDWKLPNIMADAQKKEIA